MYNPLACQDTGMPTTSFFQHMAQRCCELLRVAASSEVREQLRLWAADFNEQARSRRSLGDRRKRLKRRRLLAPHDG
jgi:hypothetical protein